MKQLLLGKTKVGVMRGKAGSSAFSQTRNFPTFKGEKIDSHFAVGDFNRKRTPTPTRGWRQVWGVVRTWRFSA
jgi:hypothetical protein